MRDWLLLCCAAVTAHPSLPREANQGPLWRPDYGCGASRVSAACTDRRPPSSPQVRALARAFLDAPAIGPVGGDLSQCEWDSLLGLARSIQGRPPYEVVAALRYYGYAVLNPCLGMPETQRPHPPYAGLHEIVDECGELNKVNVLAELVFDMSTERDVHGAGSDRLVRFIRGRPELVRRLAGTSGMWFEGRGSFLPDLLFQDAYRSRPLRDLAQADDGRR